MCSWRDQSLQTLIIVKWAVFQVCSWRDQSLQTLIIVKWAVFQVCSWRNQSLQTINHTHIGKIAKIGLVFGLYTVIWLPQLKGEIIHKVGHFDL